MLKKTLRLSGAYKGIWGSAKPLALRGVLLATLAGLLEGTALLALIPLINQLSHTNQAGIIPFLTLEVDTTTLVLGSTALFLFLGVLYAISYAASQNAFARTEFLIVEGLLSRTIQALFQAPWPAFLTLRAGELEKAVLLESQRIAFGARQLISAISYGCVALLMLCICALISLPMTLATLLIAALGTLLYFRLGKSLQQKTSELKLHENELAESLGEVFQNFKFFKFWDLNGQSQRALQSDIKRYASMHVGMHRELNRVRMLAECAILLVLALFLLAALLWLKLAPGVMLVFLAIFYRLAPRLLSMNSLLVASEVELRFLDEWNARIARLGGHHPANSEPDSLGLAPQGELHVRNLAVHAPATSTPILSDVSFSVPKGGMLAIVGESGAGKTSLLDALCGLFPIASGEILVGSQRLNSHELLAWGKASSVVLQNTPVLAGTVLQNIAWQDGAPDLARAMDAAREAHAVHFIEKLPEQWHTVLGKGGRVLSGGETQRLGLARALYRNSEVLLLDEPTSSLDAEAEDAIIEALRELKGKRTIILITHRLKLAQIADQLIALSSGRIVEQGSWQDLANRPGGVIFDLARRQKLSS